MFFCTGSSGSHTIIVAHRLSTIRSADKIVVFSKGMVAEEGTHKELMKHKSLYYNLVTAQIPPSEQKTSKGSNEVSESESSEEDDVNWVAALREEIIDDLASKAPVALARSSSGRQSLRRRRTSSRTSRASRHSKAKTTTTATTKEEDKVPTVPLSKILHMNATEWPYILAGVVGAGIQGSIIPLYAVMFGEVLGVRPWVYSMSSCLCKGTVHFQMNTELPLVDETIFFW
ncbi:Multidrug resistance protein 1 [Chionoecetes opilio]|uniref:Multidrug resistance protein 1 n=1 Tax=Chionoecetes opilio TaxID=41210 RepID=A0A8J4XXX0_CHIOP|nr:Multidrug resistance protein 1 [Chionoecetes opilio]